MITILVFFVTFESYYNEAFLMERYDGALHITMELKHLRWSFFGEKH